MIYGLTDEELLDLYSWAIFADGDAPDVTAICLACGALGGGSSARSASTPKPRTSRTPYAPTFI